jgi:uncharacterized protein YihD (DUF1040 family)
MRPANRIERILSKLKGIWEKEPDTRLGQLLINLIGYEKGDVYYFEDEELEKLIDEEISKLKGGQENGK